jgi:hypothetical protein
MKIGIICSIREASVEYTVLLWHYVHQKEDEGHTVHFPMRDTNQKGTSMEICTSNVEAFRTCDEIHVFYSSKSQGTHFDMGACFAMDKRIKVIASEPLTEGKSFQNLLSEWQSA